MGGSGASRSGGGLTLKHSTARPERIPVSYGALYHRGTRWWYDLSLPGHGRLRKSTGFHSLAKALRFVQNLVQQFEAGRLALSAQTTFAEFIPIYMDYISPRASEEWKRKQTYYLKKAEAFLGRLPLQSIHPHHVQEYAKTLEGYSRNTQRHHLFGLSGLLTGAQKLGHVVSNPVKAVLKPKQEMREVYIPRARLDAICAVAGDRGGFFQFLALTGLRHAEARALTRSHYDPQHHLLRFAGKKGDKPRAIPLLPEAEAIIRQEPVSLHDERIFWRWHNNAANSRALKAAQEKAGIATYEDAPYKVHDLRHTFITDCIQAGIPPHIVAEMVGHRDWRSITKRYTHIQVEYLAQEARKLHRYRDKGQTGSERAGRRVE